MHYTSLASFAVVGLALIAPLVSAHPANKTSKNPSYSTIKSTPKPKSYADAEPQAHSEFDSADCYRVSSPECDKAYDDSLAAFKAENPDYDFNAEPYADSKRNSNVCKCTGSLLHGGYKGQCKYGDGYGYIDSVCFPGRGQCCSWCCRDDIDGYADHCVPTNKRNHDPNCPGDGPDSKPLPY